MTDLHKAVRRRSCDPYDHKGRRIVVMLAPGDVIAFKEERTRRWFSAPLRSVMQAVICWNVDAERAARKAARRNAK